MIKKTLENVCEIILNAKQVEIIKINKKGDIFCMYNLNDSDMGWQIFKISKDDFLKTIDNLQGDNEDLYQDYLSKFTK